MYELDNISLHNWYLVDADDISVQGISGIIGPTGTGKSSLLDAIQTVIGGNNRLAVHLNSAAGDRQDRTVRDYCLGCVSDVDGGRPHRDRCESTVVLSFRERESGRVLSVGMMWTADKDEPSLVEERRFVADGYAFRITDFVDRTSEGEFVVQHDVMVARLRHKLGPKNFDLYPNATRYVAEYLQRMRPRNPPDAKRFLRAFGNAMRAKENDDPTKFVRSMVLEPLPLDIRRVQDSIKVWRELEAEVKRLEDMLVDIRAIRGKYAQGFRRKIEDETDAFLLNHLERLDLEILAAQQDDARAKAQTAKSIAETLINSHDTEIATLSNELVSLKTQLAQSDTAGRLEGFAEVERQIALNRTKTQITLSQTLKVYLDAAHARLIQKNLPNSCQASLGAALELQALVANRQPQDWLADAERVEQLAAATRSLSNATDSLRMQSGGLTKEVFDLEARERALGQQLQSAGESGNLLSSETLAFMAELRRHRIDAVPLPEVVDVSDPEWAFALEALLGANREALIVPVENVEWAFDILFRNRDKFSGCRLVNTRKTASQRPRVVAGSIAEIAVTDDKNARTFIDLNVGRYVRAESMHDLEGHDNAILRNGKTNSGLSLRVFRDRRTILGKAAKTHALAAAREEHAEIKAALKSKRETRALIDAAMVHLENLRKAEPSEIGTLAGDVRKANSELASLTRQRAAVETDDDRHLVEQIADTTRMIGEYAGEKKEAEIEARNAGVAAEVADKHARDARQKAAKLIELEERQAAVQDGTVAMSIIDILGLRDSTIATARQRVQNEPVLTPEYRADRRKYFRDEIARIKEEQRERNSGGADADRLLMRASNALVDFFVNKLGTNPLDEGAGHTDKFMWLVRREEAINKNELRPHQEKLATARIEMEAALKENLLTKLGENFERLDVQLKTLNERLGQYVFVGQRYQFSKSVNLAMKPLYDLVRKVANNPERGFIGLQEDASGSKADEAMAKAMAEVEQLVNEQQDTRLFEDYRNYFEFELNLVSQNERGEQILTPFSKIVGKLSGGQREAPYYVAIAASMVSVYYPKGKPGEEPQGLGLVVFDEAFNRLDVPNTQKLVALFRSLGLQIVVATPEDRRGTLIECVDSVINVNRRAGSSDVFMTTARIGDKARASMAQENPEHRGIEAFRAATAAE
jgi:uncharacterized protein YPO0396